VSTRSDLAALNARFFARLRALRITPNLDEQGQPTDASWLDAAPAQEAA
jgi:hypothetical protein